MKRLSSSCVFGQNKDRTFRVQPQGVLCATHDGICQTSRCRCRYIESLKGMARKRHDKRDTYNRADLLTVTSILPVQEIPVI